MSLANPEHPLVGQRAENRHIPEIQRTGNGINVCFEPNALGWSRLQNGLAMYLESAVLPPTEDG